MIISCVYTKQKDKHMTDLIIPTAQEFFNQVTALDSKLDINRACNELLDALAAKYATSTVSKKLTAYKKLFYTFQHTNPELNENVETKDGTNTQHIAARLLTLSDEQKQTLGADRSERDNARAGFDKDGELREVETPGIDITAVITKSVECLGSIDPHTIGAGIINLTGLRANEQNMPTRKYPEWELIEHEMIAVDEFLIAFKGISKKPNYEDASAYYTRATLAPAQMIVDAQKRYLSSKSVKSIPSDYETYRKGFQDTFYNRYRELFGRELSTIEAYDDNGNLINTNGSPHKGRAFYACALRTILKSGKSFGNSASDKYIQLCLAHENVGITIKYLGRYDEKDFINPIDINIRTNIKGLGKMTTAPVALLAPAKETPAPTTNETPAPTTNETPAPTAQKSTKAPAKKGKPAPKNTLDIDAFITALDSDLQIKFAELMNTESSLTNALIAIVKAAKQQGTSTNNGNIITAKKITVSDEVAAIVKAVMVYNKEQTTTTNRVVPTYSLINKIAEKCLDKTIAKVTVDNWITANTATLHKEIEALDIPGGLYNSMWNGKNHRKTMDTVIESVITVFNRG